MRMMRLRGKTIGIVGFGCIGQAVAVKARAFGFNIIALYPAVAGGTVDAMDWRLADLPGAAGGVGFCNAARAVDGGYAQSDWGGGTGGYAAGGVFD